MEEQRLEDVEELLDELAEEPPSPEVANSCQSCNPEVQLLTDGTRQNSSK